MSVKFRTQTSARNSLSSLIEAIGAAEQNEQLRNKAISEAVAADNQVKTNIASNYTDAVDNIVTPYDVTAANVYSSSLDSLIQDHPEAFFTKLEGDAKLNEKTSEMDYYTKAIDGAKNKYDSIKDLKDEDYLGWSLDTIMEELKYVKNFQASLREDPLDPESKGIAAIGHYKAGEMTDISLITSMGHYQGQLDAALIALEDNGIIDLNELFLVKTGQGEKLTKKREDVRVDTGKRLTDLHRQKNYLKNLRNSTISKFAFKGMEEDTVLGNLDLSNEDLENMFMSEAWYIKSKGEEHITQEEFELTLEAKIAEGDFTVSDYLGYLTDMENNLIDVINEEANHYYMWTGREFQQEGAKERRIRRELEKKKKN